jgi:hypothetical protein
MEGNGYVQKQRQRITEAALQEFPGCRIRFDEEDGRMVRCEIRSSTGVVINRGLSAFLSF